MQNEKGQNMARLGDMTDHGGMVTQAAPDLTHMGIPVVLDGHLVVCPRCGGPFPIIATNARTHHGIRVAYLGDKTACGATLIPS